MANVSAGRRIIKVRTTAPEKESKVSSLSFVTSLKDCAQKKDLHQGSKIHADICNSGLLEKNIYLGNILISMYAKCGALAIAQEVADELPARDVVSWNTLISGYVQLGQGNEALGCFHRMCSEGLSPNTITYACILKACSITQDVDMGEHMHGEILSGGILEKNVVLGNALIDMYAKCGAFTKVHKVLDELLVRDVVSWSALIAGYVQRGQGQKALDCFQRMQREGLFANAVTYVCILKACGLVQEGNMGKQIHDEIANQGLLENNVVLGTALVDMYVKCGNLTKAQQIFDELHVAAMSLLGIHSLQDMSNKGKVRKL